MPNTELITRKLTDEERAALDAKIGPPKAPRPKNAKERARIAKQELAAAPKPEQPAPDPKPTADEARAKLQETADAIAKATRLKNAAAIITAKSGREARIRFEERSLAFISVHGDKIRVHVQHYGREDRLAASSVAEAAKLVKTSERRKPKTLKE